MDVDIGCYRLIIEEAMIALSDRRAAVFWRAILFLVFLYFFSIAVHLNCQSRNPVLSK